MRTLQLLGGLTLYFLFCNQAFAQFVPPISIPGSTTWSSTLPEGVQDSILWEANMEVGGLADWHENAPSYAGGSGNNLNHGGGIYITDPTGGADVAALHSNYGEAHTGAFSVETIISNATRSDLQLGESRDSRRAVRLMRWLDADGEELPTFAYYSTFIYIPEDYDPNRYAHWDEPGIPGDEWWNVFQFKSEDTSIDDVTDPTRNVSAHSLNIYKHQNGSLGLYLWSAIDELQHPAVRFKALPTRQWVHVEVMYKARGNNQGKVLVWQDGTLIFNRKNIQTLERPGDRVVFGLGNYTEHVDGGEADGMASLFFDDSIISKKKVHPYLD